MKQLKIDKVQNGFVVSVIDLEGDSRAVEQKLVAKTYNDVTDIIKEIYPLH